MRDKIHAQRGVSLIAAIFIIVVLAFMGVVFVTFIGTGGFTAVNDVQSAQALSLAEGGLAYALKNVAFPNYSTAGAAVSLGAGTFSVATPTYLTADPGVGGTTISVQSTANFPASGRIVVDSELIDYTGTTPTSFTGAVRGSGGTTATAHPAGNSVYPATTVTADPGVAGTSVSVNSTAGYSIPGIIRMNTEYLFCAGASANAFTNCTRGYKGTVPAGHPSGTAVYQYAVTSSGSAGNAKRSVKALVDGSSREAITNGLFPSGSLVDWPDGGCPPGKNQGSVAIDMTNSATTDGTGSLNIATQWGKNQTMNDCRQQTLANPIPPSTPVILNLKYKFFSILQCGTRATCGFAVDFVYSSGPAVTVWSNTAYPAAWTATGVIPLTTKAGANLTAVRITYNLNSGNFPFAFTEGWVDEVSLTTPGGVTVLSWQEMVQ